ncbi:helix-turn-helix domain-containing protein [Sphingobacterium sp.]|uniref:helix-turn-helix domain-containing protein n=1 Tax=Sphingobacterium sp. TaxID=341027 RepID=UPI0031D4193E
MFDKGIIRKCGDPIKDNETCYTEWEGVCHSTKKLQSNDFIITLSKSRRGAHCIDSDNYVMQGYQLHLVFPGQQSHFSILDYTVIYQLRISKVNFDKICYALRFGQHLYRKYPIQDLTKTEFEIFRYELTTIGNELGMDRPLLEIICSRARIVLQEISRIIEKRVRDISLFRIPTVLADFLRLVELKYNQEHTVTYYAKKLNVSSDYLAILTRCHLNVTPKQIIRDHILVESMRLLAVVPMTIKEATYQLGFQDQVAFTHFFKSLTGMSPSEFQKRQ